MPSTAPLARNSTLVIVKPAAGVAVAVMVWVVLTGMDAAASGALIATLGALAGVVVKVTEPLVLTLPALSVARATTV